jgi:hypothetical protein
VEDWLKSVGNFAKNLGAAPPELIIGIDEMKARVP